MTAAAGTTHPKGGTFGGITALMGLITTLTDETTGPYGVWGILEDCLVRLEGFLWSWCP
jgi:hypothetical protein